MVMRLCGRNHARVTNFASGQTNFVNYFFTTRFLEKENDMTKTADKNVTVADLLAPRPPSIDIDQHKADLERRRIEADKVCPPLERLRLCSPAYAREKEEAKPRYKWTVEFTIIKRNKPGAKIDKDNYDILDIVDDDSGGFELEKKTATVVAQNERDAWAILCDRRGDWPNRRTASPVFTKGAQVKKGK
jgi:hypothetical protein